MSGNLLISGASVFDTTFSIQNDPNGLPDMTWNITRIERDAFLGRFGAPERIKFSELLKWEHEGDKWCNVDREKVYRFMNQPNTHVRRPDWSMKGVAERDYLLLELPAIAMTLQPASGPWLQFPIDGNHRMLAREELGLADYERFVVPAKLEGEYRIRFTEL